jgi:hypothetical protein
MNSNLRCATEDSTRTTMYSIFIQIAFFIISKNSRKERHAFFVELKERFDAVHRSNIKYLKKLEEKFVSFTLCLFSFFFIEIQVCWQRWRTTHQTGFGQVKIRP